MLPPLSRRSRAYITVFAATLFIGAGQLFAQSDTWSGAISGNWTDSGNWISGNIPGTGDTATFDSDGSGNTTIDLNGDVTIHQITFTSGNVTSYTIGGGNIIFDNTSINDDNINIDGSVPANTTLTFDAGIFLGTDASTNDINFDLDSTAANVSLIINGNIDTKSGGTAGVKRLEFGDFSNNPDDGVAIINGDILNNGGATRIETYIAGATVTMNGSAIGTGNRQRTIIRDGGTLNIAGTGRAGEGTFEIRSGNVNITSNNQLWESNLILGDTTQGNAGDATLTIGNSNTATLSTSVFYEAHGGSGESGANSTVANRAYILGGTIQHDNYYTYRVQDNTLISGPELTISSNITSDTGNRGLTKQGGGTLLLNSQTLSLGAIIVQDGLLQLGVDDAFNNLLRNFHVEAQDYNFTTSPSTPVLDINGKTATVNAINLGSPGTFLAGSKASPVSGVDVLLDDSVGGGLLSHDNTVNVRNGTTDLIQFTGRAGGFFQGGQQILGNTSGALAYIDRSYRNGTDGNISIRMISGTFLDGELLKQVNNSGVEAGRTATAVGSNMTTQDLGLGDIRNGQAVINADLQIVDNGSNQGGISYVVEDGKNDIDLVINGDISDDATPGDNTKFFRDITTQDDGVIQMNGNNTHDRTFISNRKLIAGSGDIFGTGNGTRQNGDGDGRVWLQQNNTGSKWIWDGAPTLDINGQALILKENFLIGGGATNNVSVLENIRVEDSAGGGQLILSGNNSSQRNDLTYQAGTGYVARVTPGPQRTATIDAEVRIDHHSTWNIQNGIDDVDLIMAGNIKDPTQTWNLTKIGDGTIRLEGTANNFNQLVINEGRVIATNAGALGDNLTRVGGGSLSGNNTLNAILEFQATTDQSLGLSFQIGEYTNVANSKVEDTGSGTILNNGAGVLTFTDEFFINQNANVLADRTLTLGGNNTGRNTINGLVRDVSTNASAPTLGLIKTGSGSWFLLGDNSYTGDTDVQEGRLDLYGTSLPGDLNIAANASFGGDAQIGGNATFGGNSTLFVDASTPEAFTVSGDSNFSGGANITVSLDGKGGDVNGNIIVFDYAGTLGSNGSLTFANFNSAVTGDTATSARGGSTTLQDDGDKLFVNLGFATRTWNGNSGNTTWNEGGASDTNWVEGDMQFYNGDTVVFDDANSGAGGNTTRTVNVTVPVSPNKIDVQADTVDFTFSGSEITIEDQLLISGNSNVRFNNVISGNGMVVKGNGDDGARDTAGFLVLAGNNTYTGGTLIQERNIQITNNNALGTGLVTLSDDNQGSGNSGENQDPVLQLTGSATNVANDFYFTNGGGSKTIQSINNSLKTLTGTLTTDEQGQYESRLDPNTTARAIDYQGKITGIGGLHNIGFGNVTLSNANNDFKGWLTTYRGNTNVASIKNAGVASHAGAGNKIQLGMRSFTGTLTYTGTGDSTDRQVQIGDRWFTDGAGYGGGGRIRNNGTGALNFTNSAFNIQDSEALATLDARTLTLGGTYDGSSGSNRIDGAIVNNNATDGTAGVDPEEVLSVAVDGSSWALGGTNTYTGNTTVTGNSTALFINGDNSGAIGDVTVGAGSDTPTLGGIGTIGGNTTINAGATHSAGTSAAAGSVGQQTISADLSYGNSATVAWDLVANSTSNPGTDFDQFIVNNGGTISFDSALNLEITFGSGVDIDATFWNNGAGVNEWQILDGTLAAGLPTVNVSFDVSAASNNQFFNSSAFQILDDSIATGNSGIWLRQIAPIPEPSTYALMSLALAAFGWVTRKRRGHAANQ